MRVTGALTDVAFTLLADRDGVHWGYQLSKASGVRSGVLYPMLTRMLDAGWLTDGWEDPATIDGRPPRRYYRLTDAGIEQLGSVADRGRQKAGARIRAVPKWT